MALPPGRYTVVIRRTGFAPVVRGVTVAGAVALDVALAPSPFQLEPVTVTATRSPVAADASPLQRGRRSAVHAHGLHAVGRYKEFALDPGRNLIVRLSAGDVD